MIKYDLNDKTNYLDSFNCNIETAFIKYLTLLDEFIVSILPNSHLKHFNCILIKGIENIYHIFNLLLLYSKNIDFTYHHCQRCYLYYCEFIQQIKDNNELLNLNIKDATIFIHKKITYNICKANPLSTSLEQNNMLVLDKTILFHKVLFFG